MPKGIYTRTKDNTRNLGKALRGRKLSLECKEKISQSLKGRIFSQESRQKMSEARKKIGSPWMIGRKHSDAIKHQLSIDRMGRNNPMYGKTPWNKNKKASLDFRIKLSKAHFGKMTGKNHPNWKGGKNSISGQIKSSLNYRLWREAIFKRDNYTCIWCGLKGYLNADHIEPLSIILKKNKIETFKEALICKRLWDINNGRTLCVPCHRKTDTYASRVNKYIKLIRN